MNHCAHCADYYWWRMRDLGPVTSRNPDNVAFLLYYRASAYMWVKGKL